MSNLDNHALAVSTEFSLRTALRCLVAMAMLDLGRFSSQLVDGLFGRVRELCVNHSVSNSIDLASHEVAQLLVAFGAWQATNMKIGMLAGPSEGWLDLAEGFGTSIGQLIPNTYNK